MTDPFALGDDLGPAKVIHVQEPAIGLRGVLVVDNVAAGPSIGGLRMAEDPRTGYMWGLFGRNVAAGAGGSKNMDYMLNRTTDSGATWGLNGNAFGIIVANADSTQPQPKFGTVNALLGGVHHAFP